MEKATGTSIENVYYEESSDLTLFCAFPFVTTYPEIDSLIENNLPQLEMIFFCFE